MKVWWTGSRTTLQRAVVPRQWPPFTIRRRNYRSVLQHSMLGREWLHKTGAKWLPCGRHEDAIAKSSVFTGIIGAAARYSKFPYSVFSRGIETGWTQKSRRGQYEATQKRFARVRTGFAVLKSMVRTRLKLLTHCPGVIKLCIIVMGSRGSHQIPIIFSSKSFKTSSYPL